VIPVGLQSAQCPICTASLAADQAGARRTEQSLFARVREDPGCSP